MHGDQRSPGIIPLAVKHAFSIIQETPSREFLLRVSYLEIYNEVVNDLLNPAGQNLRIREDNQGTFVEGIKEEVVLSPAHALSLIAAGEGLELRMTTSTRLKSCLYSFTFPGGPMYPTRVVRHAAWSNVSNKKYYRNLRTHQNYSP